MRQVLNLAYYEIVHILKDPILLLMVLVAPVFYAVLFGFIYIQGSLINIPLGIVDLDNSQISRSISEAYKNDPYFKVIDNVDNYDELKQAMNDGTVRAGVVIPENLSQKIAAQRPTEVLSVYDTSNLIWGYNTRKNIRQVINKFNQQNTWRYMQQKGLDNQQINQAVNVLDTNIQIWYNPTLNYGNFIFLGLMMMVIHQIGLLSVAMTVPREKERNSWVQYVSAPIASWKIMLGKCLPYLVSNFFNYTLLLWFSAVIFNFKIEGSVFMLILLGLLYVIIITFIGFFVSLHVPNSLQATRYLMLLSVPLFLISGYTWPGTHMPDLLNGFSRLMPFTWMSEAVRWVALKSYTFMDLKITLLVMTCMAVMAIGLSFRFDKLRKVRSNPGLRVNSGLQYPSQKLKRYN